MASKTGKRKADNPNLSPKIPTKLDKKEEKLEYLNKKQVIERYKDLEVEYKKILKEKVLLENRVKKMKDDTKEINKTVSIEKPKHKLNLKTVTLNLPVRFVSSKPFV